MPLARTILNMAVPDASGSPLLSFSPMGRQQEHFPVRDDRQDRDLTRRAAEMVIQHAGEDPLDEGADPTVVAYFRRCRDALAEQVMGQRRR